MELLVTACKLLFVPFLPIGVYWSDRIREVPCISKRCCCGLPINPEALVQMQK
jgi:hypothetical protein